MPPWWTTAKEKPFGCGCCGRNAVHCVTAYFIRSHTKDNPLRNRTMETTKLTVKPMTNRSVGEEMAVIDRRVMEDLGLERGDYVVIESHNGEDAVANVRPGFNDADDRTIRIDEELRLATAVEFGLRIAVGMANAMSGDRITVDLPEDLPTDDLPGLRVRDALVDRVVTGGETVEIAPEGPSPEASGQRVPLRIADTDPSGPVIGKDWTRITVSETPAEDLSVEDGESRGSNAVTYEDVGGLDTELKQVREMIELPMDHPELFDALGVDPPRGVLLYGPPGTGKTLIARALTTETDAHVQVISGPEIVSKHQGETEQRLRDVFENAEENAPAIVVIDEIDSITASRDTGSDTDRRVISQLLSLLDGLGDRSRVTVIGTTDRVNTIDPALRRPGRFDREIEIGVPDRAGRSEIFEVHTRGMALADDINLEAYAENTHGFVGADIENLIRESAMCALRRVRSDIDPDADTVDPAVLDALRVTDRDIRRALKGVEPSALREVFVELPDVTWDDVGGLADAKARLQESVQWPLAYPDAFKRVDLRPAKGVLLYGPPGTGKTLLAKAVANEAESNFISIKGPELLDKYVGESERGVRDVFATARENAPTVVFFDELDALAAERGGDAGGSNVGERVVSQLLTELDGLEALEDVVVIATTNRPDLIDDALLRSGRLDRHIHVSTPDREARREIFGVHTREKPLADDVDLDALARETEDYVGADIEAVCREASTAAVREFVDASDASVEGIVLTREHFERALSAVESSADDGPRID